MHQDAPTFYFCLNTNSYSVVSNQKKVVYLLRVLIINLQCRKSTVLGNCLEVEKEDRR